MEPRPLKAKPKGEPSAYKRWKRRARFHVIRVAMALLGLIPLGLARAFGEWLGGLGYQLANRERARALESLERAFPETSVSEREALAEKCFRHLGRAAMEVICIRQVDRELRELVQWPDDSKAALQRGLAGGKGVVFVSAHVGHWELLARRVAKDGHPCQSIARETSDARLTEWLQDFRARGGVKSIWRGGDGAARQMLRALKGGEILGLLIDQDTEVQSFWVPFFGLPAKTPRAAADLALRTGASVVFGVCPRGEDGRYQLLLEEVIPVQTGDKERDALVLTADLTARIEKAIRRFPEQWVWMHQRWKSRPT